MDEEQIEKDIEWLLRREEYRIANNIFLFYVLAMLIIGIVSFW